MEVSVRRSKEKHIHIYKHIEVRHRHGGDVKEL